MDPHDPNLINQDARMRRQMRVASVLMTLVALAIVAWLIVATGQ